MLYKLWSILMSLIFMNNIMILKYLVKNQFKSLLMIILNIL